MWGDRHVRRTRSLGSPVPRQLSGLVRPTRATVSCVSSVSSAGDVDNDGCDEVLIGAPGEDTAGEGRQQPLQFQVCRHFESIFRGPLQRKLAASLAGKLPAGQIDQLPHLGGQLLQIEGELSIDPGATRGGSPLGSGSDFPAGSKEWGLEICPRNACC